MCAVRVGHQARRRYRAALARRRAEQRQAEELHSLRAEVMALREEVAELRDIFLSERR